MVRESLVRALLGAEGVCAPSAGTCLVPAWIQLAEGWGAIPRLRQRLAHLATPPQAELLAEIERLYLDGYVRSILQIRSAIDVFAAFEREKLPVVAFKGLASLAVLYPSLERRVMLDVDLLIGEPDLARAVAVLGELGFRPEVTGNLAEYVDFVRHAPGFGGNEELALHNDRGCTIDLHWRLGRGLDTQAILDRRRRARLLGGCLAVVADGDGILLCAHHSLRNHFSPDRIMRDLFDLELWWERGLRENFLEDTWREAGARGLAVPLLALTSILAEYHPDGAGADAAAGLDKAASPEQRGSARRLVALFMAQVREGTFERDLLYLFHSSELKQMLGGILTGGRRHMAMVRSMDKALVGEPTTFAHRLAVLAQSLGRLRPRHIGMLRALARTKDEFRLSEPGVGTSADAAGKSARAT
jgi:hypothetical protein